MAFRYMMQNKYIIQYVKYQSYIINILKWQFLKCSVIYFFRLDFYKDTKQILKTWILSYHAPTLSYRACILSYRASIL